MNSMKNKQGTQSKYFPTRLEQFSASLNRFACAFVFDANMNINCFQPVFKEARRLRESIEHSFLMLYTLSALVVCTVAVSFFLGLCFDYINKL